MAAQNVSPETFDFLVRRDDLHRCEFRPATPASAVTLGAGQVLLAVDAFGFTANNITYAVFGDAMKYWNFFPAPDGWGRVPVWGFATVARSNHPDVAVGERVYGYLPMSTHFVADAGQVTASGFTDMAAHRQEMDAFYNLYSRTAADPGYDPAREAEQMLLRPLFFTGFLIDDFLADSGFFGAKRVVVSSASSKTSIALAFQLFQHGRERCEVVGLTSKRSVPFVESLGDSSPRRRVHRHRDARRIRCNGVRRHGRRRRRYHAHPPPLRRRSKVQLPSRRHALGPAGVRHRGAGTDADAVLGARPARQAHERLGSGGVSAARGRRMDEVPSARRQLDHGRASQRQGRDRARVPRDPRGPCRSAQGLRAVTRPRALSPYDCDYAIGRFL